MAEEKKTYTRRCKRCGGYFASYSNRTYICPECKKENKAEYYGKKTVREKQAASCLPLSIKQIMRLLMKYNKEHNTNLSYGKFAEAIRLGKIEVNRNEHRLPKKEK